MDNPTIMQEKIRRNFVTIVTDLSSVDEVLDVLYERCRFTRNDYQKVQAERTDFGKARILLLMLSCKPDAILDFMEQIKESDNHIYRTIIDTSLESSPTGVQRSCSDDVSLILKESDTLKAYLGFCLPMYLKEAKGKIIHLQKIVEFLQNLCHVHQLPPAVTSQIVIQALHDALPKVIITEEDPAKVHGVTWKHTSSDGSYGLLDSAIVNSSYAECDTIDTEASCINHDLVGSSRGDLVRQAMRQSLQKLDITLQMSHLELTDTDIHMLGQSVEGEIDKAINVMVQRIEGRRQTLKAAVQQTVKRNLEARRNWRTKVETGLAEAQGFLDDTSSQYGSEYSKQMDTETMSSITTKCHYLIEDIELTTVKVPVPLNPMLRFNSYIPVSEITSFGSIEVLQGNVEESPVAVDCGPVTQDRPLVIGQKGRGLGKFRHPTDVAVCPESGRIMVADPDNNRVQVLDDSFSHIMYIDKDGTGEALKWPGVAAVNNSGEVIILDVAANAILVYTASGKFSRKLPGSWHKPLAMAVDEEGNIYVCERNTYEIKVLNQAGVVMKTFGGQGTGPGQFSGMISHIAIYRDLVLVSASGRIHQFTKGGLFVNHLEPNRELRAKGMTVTPGNDLIVCDERGCISVVRGDRVIGRLGEQGDEPWQLHDPLGVAVTKTGRIIVANQLNDNVLVYDMVRKIYKSQ